MKFIEKLDRAVSKNNSLLCIGLDPDPALMLPGLDIYEFNREIIDSTSDLVCAYKPQFAFYEALGTAGIEALNKTIRHIPENIPVIGDAKRGDIGNTAKAYATAIFDVLDCDAVTVNPYLGQDSLEPFLNYKDRGVFILCRTSNQGAVDFQSLNVAPEGRHLFEVVAERSSKWNKHGNIGLVIGATYPDELKLIHQTYPELPLLIPGIGAQGGDVELTIKYGTSGAGSRAIINSSRGIIYASRGNDFARAAREGAIQLRKQINDFRTPG